MKKLIKRKSASEPADLVPPQAETDLAGLVNKMYEQLVALEKKVDTLISRPADRAQDGGRFRHSGRGGGERYEGRPRERSFTRAVCAECGKECELPFKPTGDRPVYCRDCFSARKDSRGGDFPRERNFDNRGQEKGERSGKKRGPFSRRRKGHS